MKTRPGSLIHSIATLLIIGVLIQPVFALDATTADNLALAILTQSGKSGGVCEIPRAGDGQLARAFVQKSKLLVHAMNPDTASVRAVRALLEPTGQVGLRAYVEKGTPSSIPLADNYADLVVITDCIDATLGSIPVAEIVRAMCPGGKAYIGRAVSEGAGLSTTALQTWISGRSDAVVTTDAQGTWAIITKKNPFGMDEWTHEMHGPDNNPFSNDSIAKWPYLMQFRAKPTIGIIRHGATVAGGGRMYNMINEGNYVGQSVLRTYRIYNGQMLWKKTVESYNMPQRPTKSSFMVATQNSLFFINGGKVDEINGETGAITRSIPVETATGSEVKWIAVDGSYLYTLSGATSLDSLPPDEYTFKKIWYGTKISAFTLANGTSAWTFNEPGRIDAREIGISDGKLYFFALRTRVVALNAATGAQLWETRNASVITLLMNRPGGGTDPVGSASGFLCSPKGIYICPPEAAKFVALSSTDGSLMWSMDRSGNRSQAKVLTSSGILFNRDISDITRRAWNVNTNTSVSQYNNIRMGGGCGMISASPDGIFGNAGGESFSFSESRNLPAQTYKTSCDIPMFASNGMAINSTNTDCTCERVRGLVAEAPAGNFVFDRTAVQSERLENGPASADLSAVVTVNATDWSTHRANISHTGFVGVTLNTNPNLIARHTRAYPYDATYAKCADNTDQENTPPATAGTRIFWGGTDGYVRCYDIATKTETWAFATGGRIMATPTVADGCVYVGSMDGYAYCIEAHTGRLVWRFRGAPAERRISLFGHLASTWPINTGILVQGGTAYFAAGSSEGLGYGNHVYALNARTGAIVWQNNTSGSAYGVRDRLGTQPCGGMTIVGGKLWLQSGPGRPGIYNLATGTLDSLLGDLSGQHGGFMSVRGKEIGVLDATHVIVCGRYQFSDHGDRGFTIADRPLTPLDCIQIDASGNPRYPQVELLVSGARAPAWDNTTFYTVTDGQRYLEKWNISAVTSTVNSTVATRLPSSYQSWQRMYEGAQRGMGGKATEFSQWRLTTDAEINAIALANNGVVVTRGRKATNDDPQTNWTWFVSIISRDAATVVWQAQLPSTPLQDGIAITRAGEIVVSLKDGSQLVYGTGPAVSVALRPERVRSTARNGLVPVVAAEHTTDAPFAQAQTSVTQEKRDPARGTLIDDERALKASFPLKDSMVTMADGTRAQLRDITPADRAALVYQPRDMKWNPSSPCLAVSSVTASSVSSKANNADNTFDRRLTTRWSPAGAGEQWIRYDLGSVREVSSADILWFSRGKTAIPFRIELSSDGTSFELAENGILEGSGTQETRRSFLARDARYVRITISIEKASAIPGLVEVGIHGSAGEDQALVR